MPAATRHHFIKEAQKKTVLYLGPPLMPAFTKGRTEMQDDSWMRRTTGRKPVAAEVAAWWIMMIRKLQRASSDMRDTG
jgi:hypothetical protein